LKTLHLSFAATILFLTSCGGGTAGGGGAGSIPATPVGLTGVSGNAQVSLSWTASSGATSYHVKRSTTTGSGYAQVGAPSSTTFTDTALTNGTTYYYVVSAINPAGESANSTEVSATPNVVPATPTGLSAVAGNAEVALSWNPSSGATSYHVKYCAIGNGQSTGIATVSTTNYTNTGLVNGTNYCYVVSALNTAGESPDSSQVTATPVASFSAVHVMVDVLTNRHAISPYVYGGSYPQSASTVTDSGLSVVRWGGNATSTYNWQNHTYNADNDYYFEDFTSQGFNSGADSDSTAFVQDVIAAGSNPIMTMVMLPWVAKSAETAPPNPNYHWSFSASKYGTQCHIDPYNSDAGDGIVFSSTCDISPTYLTASPTDAYVPLLDDHSDSCTAGTTCVYRSDWAAALATAFGNNNPHFYDMDNEIDIWGSTHRDIHPSPSGYQELRDTYLSEARSLKAWDAQAIRLGPVSCCWYFYWNGANGSDKAAHAGLDFLPWWLNEVYWQDQIAGTKSLDVFDIHAYPDRPTEPTLSLQQALATRIYRDYWDPTYVSESKDINQPYVTQIQPNKTIPFRIPRMRAMLNMIYPGVPLSITEWSAEFAGAADFSTALGDADAYGIIGRERVYLASRWEAPNPSNPNYQTLKLFTNYDGQHHGFAPISVSATNDASANLFSSFAAVNGAGTSMTLLIVNKDPQNNAQTQFAFTGFTASQVTVYTLSQSSATIVASATKTWTSSMSFAPYTATMLVIAGATPNLPAAEWDLNPDTIMVPANGSVTLSPKITLGASTVMLETPVSDAGISLTVSSATLTTSQNGSVNVVAGHTPGFYHYSIPGTDSSTTTNQSGWIVVGNPPATLSAIGQGQTGNVGTTLATPLSVVLAAGSSGGSSTGASILFTTDGGTLSNGSTNGTKVIAVTDSSGKASVTLTLPGTAGNVHVTAEGPYGLGHPTATFTETATWSENQLRKTRAN